MQQFILTSKTYIEKAKKLQEKISSIQTILVMDEPASSLDLANTNKVLNIDGKITIKGGSKNLYLYSGAKIKIKNKNKVSKKMHIFDNH